MITKEKPLYEKLIVYHLTKEFYILNVSEECFNNSLKIECVGLCDGIKILFEEQKIKAIEYLRNKGYKECKV